MAYNITLIKGDGIGPELAEVAKKCVEATGVKVIWDEVEAGIDVMSREGTPLPEKTIESVKKNKLALKAPITTPVGTGFRSVNVALRQLLGLYACVRPCKSKKTGIYRLGRRLPSCLSTDVFPTRRCP